MTIFADLKRGSTMMRRFTQAAVVAAAMAAPVFAGVMIAPQAQADPTYHVSFPVPVTVNTPDGPKTFYEGRTQQALTPQAMNDRKQQLRDEGVKANSSPVSYPGPKNPANSAP
jgi:hypothetical protein